MSSKEVLDTTNDLIEGDLAFRGTRPSQQSSEPVSTASGKQAVMRTIHSDPGARKVKITLSGDSFLVGDTSMLLTSYDTVGRGTGFISADWMNVVLDVSTLPDQFIPLGVQGGFSDGVAAMSGLQSKQSGTLYVDADGIVLPEGLDGIEEGGPFLDLEFRSPEKKPPSLAGVSWSVMTGAGSQVKAIVGADKAGRSCFGASRGPQGDPEDRAD